LKRSQAILVGPQNKKDAAKLHILAHVGFGLENGEDKPTASQRRMNDKSENAK